MRWSPSTKVLKSVTGVRSAHAAWALRARVGSDADAAKAPTATTTLAHHAAHRIRARYPVTRRGASPAPGDSAVRDRRLDDTLHAPECGALEPVRRVARLVPARVVEHPELDPAHARELELAMVGVARAVVAAPVDLDADLLGRGQQLALHAR